MGNIPIISQIPIVSTITDIFSPSSHNPSSPSPQPIKFIPINQEPIIFRPRYEPYEYIPPSSEPSLVDDFKKISIKTL